MASLSSSAVPHDAAFARCGELACQKDSYQRTLTTTVISCAPRAVAPVAVAKGKKGKGGAATGVASSSLANAPLLFDVVLADTVLFPEGGGQPSDSGTVGGAACSGVENRDGVAVHVVEGPAPLAVGDEVVVDVAWGRRWHNMGMHSCQHLLTALAVKLFSLETTSWGLGAEVSFLELATPTISDAQLKALEVAANDGKEGVAEVT